MTGSHAEERGTIFSLIRDSLVARILALFFVTFFIFLAIIYQQSFREHLITNDPDGDFVAERLMSELRMGFEEGQSSSEILKRDFIRILREQNPSLSFYAYFEGRELFLNRDRPVEGFATPFGRMGHNEKCDFEGSFFFTTVGPSGREWVGNRLCEQSSSYLEIGGIDQLRVVRNETLQTYWQVFGADLLDRFWLMLLLFLAAVFLLWRMLASLTRQINISAKKIDVEHKLRLPESDVPIEVRPLIHGVNNLLMMAIDMAERERFFIAAAAHELRTPLTVLRTRLEDLPEGALRVEVINDVRYLGDIVNQLLRLTRLKSEEKSEMQRQDLRLQAKEVCSEMAIRAHNLGVSIEFEQPGEPVMVICNPSLIKVAISNLTENALSVSPAGSTICVTVTPSAEIVIKDEGGGIPESMIADIFEPFVKTPPSRKGSGLGLAIVREIMRHHRGNVSAKNVKAGAIFVLELREKTVV